MFFNLGILSNPEIEKKQRFLSRILIFKNENARNEKNGGSAFLFYSSEKGFFLHHQGLPLPPVAFPGVPVSRSGSWCPGVPVRVPSLQLPFVASPEMLPFVAFPEMF